MKRFFILFGLSVAGTAALHAQTTIDRAAALAIFKPIAEVADNPENPVTEEKVKLGRMLYYDTRLSKNRTVSCNSCHDLASFGDDGRKTSKGIHDQIGGRSAPTVYNAALHLAQFWDGRAKDVEAQAVGPVTNPIEMGMPDPEYVLKVLKSIPGYVEGFAAAFPEDKEPLSYANMGNAIGAFERKLLTPAPFDDYLNGKDDALTNEQKAGLQTFVSSGCIVCHSGAGIGGHLYQKLGLVKPWPTEDTGRFQVTQAETDKFFFKVPSLRNITETGPYLHDGSVESLDEMVAKMADHQLGKQLSKEEVSSIVAFLGALKGRVDEEYIKIPELPKDGPETPKE